MVVGQLPGLRRRTSVVELIVSSRAGISCVTVGHLVELAMDRSVGHRKDIVGLIAHLAVGYPERWLATGFDETGLISGDTEFAAGRNRFQVDELGSARPIGRHLVGSS